MAQVWDGTKWIEGEEGEQYDAQGNVIAGDEWANSGDVNANLLDKVTENTLDNPADMNVTAGKPSDPPAEGMMWSFVDGAWKQIPKEGLSLDENENENLIADINDPNATGSMEGAAGNEGLDNALKFKQKAMGDFGTSMSDMGAKMMEGPSYEYDLFG